MATTTNKGIEKPAYQQYADDPTGWTSPINANWDLIDTAFAGTYAPTALTSSSTTVTLTPTQCQNIRIKFTGSTSTATTVNVLFPDGIAGMFIVDNSTTGPFTINLKSAATGAVEFVEAVQSANTFVWLSSDSGSKGVYLADNSPLTAGTGISVVGSTVSLEVPVTAARGGTGKTSYTSGQLLIGNAAGGLTASTLTQGSNITITNGDGTITISASGSAGGVTTFSAGSTGFSPSVASAGAVTLSGTLNIANGGTGSTNATNARAALSAAKSGANSDITSITGLSTALSVSQGGTGATSASAARTNLGLGSTDNVTFNKVSVSNAVLNSAGGVGSVNLDTNTSFFGTNTSAEHYVNNVPNWASTSSTFTVQGGITPQAYGTTTWTNISDARTKKEQLPYVKGLNDLLTLNVVSYKYNGSYGTPNNNVRYYGLIAQEVLTSNFSDMVGNYTYTDPQTKQQTQLYSVDTSQLVFALINAVRELSNRVAALEAKTP